MFMNSVHSWSQWYSKNKTEIRIWNDVWVLCMYVVCASNFKMIIYASIIRLSFKLELNSLYRCTNCDGIISSTERKSSAMGSWMLRGAFLDMQKLKRSRKNCGITREREREGTL